MDAHLETLSMIFLTTCWAVAYGWVEGTVDIGHLLATTIGVTWFGRFTTYHFVLGLTIFAISFSFGFLKFTRMVYYRKRYMLFTAIGNYPYGLMAQDFAYFWFVPGPIRLDAMQWTCQGLGLGCWQIYNPWTQDLFLVPRWYLVALSISALFFFLAYRSALVNLLVTREVMKQAGFLEKTRLETTANKAADTPTPKENEEPSQPPPLPRSQQSKVDHRVTRIVDEERQELIRRLRERLERQGE
jgi:hypothetical protein